jgi:hypothetical protein
MRLRKHSLLKLLVLGWAGTFMLPAHVARSANLSPELQKYVGTWQAQFKGTTFVVLRLREQDSKTGWQRGSCYPCSSGPEGRTFGCRYHER